MEKQQKIINKINHSVNSGKTTPLGTKPNDECYTDMQDILNELCYWADKDKFVGKRIVCPCDWDITDDKDIYGIEINYDENPAEVNAFKAVKSVKITKSVEFSGTMFETTNETEEETVETKLVEYDLAEDEIEEFLRTKLTCNFVRALTQNARRWGIKSITASGYNPATDCGIKFQDVDYSKYDICITNPPFSLYAEFMQCVIGNIDFICLAPFLNRVTPNIGLPLMLKQAYLGKGRELGLDFKNPNKENEYHTKKVACDWIVSWPDAQIDVDACHYTSGISFELYKDEYPTYTEITMKDGTHPIRVPSSKFPDDYAGWMICSINVLDKLDQTAYEWYGTGFKGYYNTVNPEANPFMHKATNDMMKINGKSGFHGIVFRKKPKENVDGTND